MLSLINILMPIPHGFNTNSTAAQIGFSAKSPKPPDPTVHTAYHFAPADTEHGYSLNVRVLTYIFICSMLSPVMYSMPPLTDCAVFLDAAGI